MVEAVARGRIFISYRREESAYPAGWLFDRLTDHFGAGQVFKDIDSIAPGDDFVEVITEAVGSCDVLLALIGDEWLTVADDDGSRRIDNPRDFVRIEIEAALNRNVRVVPVLIGGARMPREAELPPTLAALSRRNALELSPSRFDFETSRLLRTLDESLAAKTPAGTEAGATVIAEHVVPVPTTGRPDPPAATTEPTPPPVPLAVTICAIAGAVLLGVGVFARWDEHNGGRSWLDLRFGAAGADHAGIFTAPSPLVLVLGTFAALALAFRPATRSVGAGLLLGFGITGVAKYLGVLSVIRGNPEPRAHAMLVFVGVLVGAILVLVAGAMLARMDPPPGATAGAGVVSALLFAAAVLIVVGCVTPFNGGGTDGVARKIVPGERWQALDPLVVAAVALVTVALVVAGRRLLAAGILIALGLEAVALWLRYLGVPVIENDSAGSFGAGSAVGLGGALLILAAGLLLWRREASEPGAIA